MCRSTDGDLAERSFKGSTKPSVPLSAESGEAC